MLSRPLLTVRVRKPANGARVGARHAVRLLGHGALLGHSVLLGHGMSLGRGALLGRGMLLRARCVVKGTACRALTFVDIRGKSHALCLLQPCAHQIDDRLIDRLALARRQPQNVKHHLV